MAKPEFELQFENFTCTSDDTALSHLKNYSCGLSKNVRRRSFNLEFILRKPLDQHEHYMAIVMPRSREDFVLLNVTGDGCNTLANKKQVPLISMARNLVRRYSNYPSKCPFEKDKTYYIRGFRFDLSLIPAVNMETPVHIQFGYHVKDMYLLKAYLTARIELKTNSNNNNKSRKKNKT
ncbi:uncharacterized protein LOC115632571 [Scaptodrosophila lebanonensis]|uniref:Uncharacterized protein LOC115632571 n=1 Tax=Drosophila lebanonensis TaxID=7225 RepID=A0A6J2UCA3_DROLE|nr:uncharacterized protein LOC115632571 [Scaptodrosophila lebanonensis]